MQLKGLWPRKKNIRNEYYNALEKADPGIEKMFEQYESTFDYKNKQIEKGDFTGIETIIYDGIMEAMDRCIIMQSDPKTIKTVQEMADILEISETAVKKRIKTGNLIARKMGNGRWKIYYSV